MTQLMALLVQHRPAAFWQRVALLFARPLPRQAPVALTAELANERREAFRVMPTPQEQRAVLRGKLSEAVKQIRAMPNDQAPW